MNVFDTTVAEAMTDVALFGKYFTAPAWNNVRWLPIIKAAFGEQLSIAELVAFKEVAGGRDPPNHKVSELVACVGRGGGKDSIASFLAAFIAITFDPAKANLRLGEDVYVLCLAVDKEQAGIAFNMTKAFFETIPVLKAMVKHIGQDSIDLNNRVTIKITTNDFRSIRGRGILCAIFDESAFWRTGTTTDDAANPDIEVYAACSPGLARVPGSMLIMISSVYRRTGMLYDSWQRNYGTDNQDTLAVLGTTTQFNPGFSQATIDRELLKDRPRASAEYNSKWRDEVEDGLIKREQVMKCVDVGVTERPPKRGNDYVALFDAATGSGKDSAAVCIGHIEAGTERVMIDAIRERKPPYSPEQIAKEFSALIRSYNISNVLADHFGGAAIAEQFLKWNVTIDHQPGAPPKSEMYLAGIQTFNSARAGMLDDDVGIDQICSLVRKNQSGGRPLIDAEKGGHDDRANVVCGVIWMLLEKPRYNLAAMGDGDINSKSIEAARQQRAEAMTDKTAWPPLNPQSATEREAIRLQAEYAAGGVSRNTNNYPGSFPAIDMNGFLIAPDMTDFMKDSTGPDFAPPANDRSRRMMDWSARSRIINW
jgi:hypothetical protein